MFSQQGWSHPEPAQLQVPSTLNHPGEIPVLCRAVRQKFWLVIKYFKFQSFYFALSADLRGAGGCRDTEDQSFGHCWELCQQQDVEQAAPGSQPFPSETQNQTQAVVQSPNYCISLWGEASCRGNPQKAAPTAPRGPQPHLPEIQNSPRNPEPS